MAGGSLVGAMFTDFYALRMCYAYWTAGEHEQWACFEVFFRKNPFKGELTIFCGPQDCLRLVRELSVSDEDVQHARTVLPGADEGFWRYFRGITGASLTVHAIDEGTVVFPREPLMVVQGHLAVCQLLEAALLNLVNFASLIATQAVRLRQLAGDQARLVELGLRRAQGPDGAMTASRFAYVGGFDATSNVMANRLYGVPIFGTQAHSYVCAFEADGQAPANPLWTPCLRYRREVCRLLGEAESQANNGELKAFANFARAFPASYDALIDTYDVLRSGLVNFCACALALHFHCEQRARGVRLDSGDLSYLSREVRSAFRLLADHYALPWLAELSIVASSDINEETLRGLQAQGHEIDVFGVGTHLVTCQQQPALGCVYKLVEVAGQPRMKLSQDISKVNFPGRKKLYRLFGKDGHAINDLITLHDEDPPQPGDSVMCRHPFEENKRATVKPSTVTELHRVVYEQGRLCQPLETLETIRDRVKLSLSAIRADNKRCHNPTAYKVSVSPSYYKYFHSNWLLRAPVGHLE